MPMPPAPTVGMGMGLGLGLGMGEGMDMPLGDDFVDYGPAPDLDLGLDMGWGMDPNFRLEEFATERATEGDSETCNECCYSFFDALCGVSRRARDLRRETAGDGQVVLDDNEMAAV
ncbi:hypothetical protein ColLi_03943 [Colletotrichum liriopes]|uniref:Uncharacterized protein n=1 Tax=Colletotrichum liriopes TaxID=708192 RepID=A0AA37GI82_9PEZI|nr:hypothetical protein ColLi_03943 [Colletotrichum liriopes]